jgi:hypothetical protein
MIQVSSYVTCHETMTFKEHRALLITPNFNKTHVCLHNKPFLTHEHKLETEHYPWKGKKENMQT